MSGVPEGVETATSEGRDLETALAAAASELGADPGQVQYKIDLDHFRGSSGGSVPRDTVRIIAWKGEASQAPATPTKAREKKAAHRPKPEGLRGAENGSTEASRFAESWFKTMLELMRVEGEVRGTGSDERIHLYVKAERAGRIIGKRGSTLGAIRHLLRLALEAHGSPIIDVDVADERQTKARTKESDRPRRDGRRERPRRDRDRSRGRDRDRDRGERSGYAPDKLRALARRAAAKASDTGKTITINLELNSYDRRIVHLAVADMEGVNTQSRVKDGTKYVAVIPE